MAGQGLESVAWPVDFFDNEKIQKLLTVQGTKGFYIYMYLCQKIFREKGYYCSWCCADGASIAREMCCCIGAGAVEETVNLCLQIGVFDKMLFDRWGILTSSDIQIQFYMASGGEVGKIIEDYWLLQKCDKCKGLLKSPFFKESGINRSTRRANKVNYIYKLNNDDDLKRSTDHIFNNNKKINNRSDLPSSSNIHSVNNIIGRVFLADGTEYQVTVEQEQRFRTVYPDIDVKSHLLQMQEWSKSNPEKRPSRKNALRFINGWLGRNQKDMEQARAVSKDKAAGRTAAGTPPNRFHNFKEREYDFRELTRQFVNREEH